MINLGGNLLKTIQLPLASEVQFADSPYTYKFIKVESGKTCLVENFKAACIFLLSGRVESEGHSLSRPEDTLLVENKSFTILGKESVSHLLLVGCSEPGSEQETVCLSHSGELKKVEKPWGYEIWITGEHPGFCLKKIFIKKGTKTSLQYHRQKRETNVLFEGTARLHFKANSMAKNDEVGSADLAFAELTPMSSIDVFPQTLHRLEAMTDILLFEVSTPQLNDVVRVADDTLRPDGRINSEHGKNET